MDFLQFREPFNAWSHAAWLALSVPATVLLLRRSNDNWSKRLSLLIFGMSIAACSLASTLFHGVQGSPDRIDLLDRVDHVGIHLLIAGTYTPLAWNLLRGRWRTGTLTAVWTTTTLSSVLLMADIRLPRPLETCEYLALGWGALLCYVEIARVLPHRTLRPLVIGGVFYSVGAVLNLLRWPEVGPVGLGHHEVFHLWVIAGSMTHVWFMMTAVVPFAWAAHARQQADPAYVRLRGATSKMERERAGQTR
ncbi:MAG: hemolysin III family protein [Isosphaeraceae bacterium]